MATSIPPLAGQPGGPAIVTTPQTGAPIKSAVEIASDEARARLAGGGSALPPEVVQRPGDTARVAAGTPAGGQFAPSLTKELPGGQPPGDGQGTQTPEPKPGEAPAPPVEPKPGDAPTGEPPTETPEEKTAREAAEALAVETPIMLGEGDAAVPLVLHADTPENAAHLQALVAQAVAGREATIAVEQAQRQLAQMEDMREYGEVDPVGFVTDMLGGNVEAGEHLALFLVSQPTLFERIKPTLLKLVQNPAELTNVSNAVAAQRGTFEKKANQAVAEGRAIRQNVTDVQATVMALLPPDMPDATRRVAFRDMLRDLRDIAVSQDLLTLPVHQIPSLLTERMAALGINPEEATARAATAAARRPGGTSTSARAVSARRPPPVVTPRSTVPKPNGKAFVTSAAQKREVAAIPAAGAGSPGGGGGLTPPRNTDGTPMSTEQTVQWHRQQLAKGIRHY